MSEQINKVLASTAQAFSTAEQKQARDNIDAQKSITYSYSGSNITAIDGSAIAQSGALTFVTHDGNLTGSGTTDSPLGLNSTVSLSSGPYSAEYNTYEVNFHNDSGYGLYNYNVMRLSSTAGTETQITDGAIDVDDSGDISISVRPTGILIDEHNGADADLTIGHSSIVFSERNYASQVVDRSSIERWNSYSAGLFTGLSHDYNLSGLGTTTSLLGLADPVKFSASGTAADSLVSSVSVGNNGFSASVPSAWTAEFTYNRGKLGYEWPSAEDTANHEGLTSHTLLVPGNVNLSSHDCSYITHNYVDLDVDNGLRMFQGYGSGSNQSGIFACVSGYSNGPTIHFQQGTANEYVDIPSIRRWNGYSAGVSAGNGLSGSGTSSSPLGLANPSIISSNSHSSYRADNFVMVTSNGGDRSYLSEFVLDFQHNGTSYSVTTASINDWNNKLFKSAIECDANSAVTAIGGSSIAGGNGWKESGNPLSTGFGGNQVTAASQYNDGAGNWAARTVKMSGLPDQTMYAFQSKPVGTGTYGVNQAGAFVAVPQSKYFTYLFHETGATVHTFDIEIFPTGLTADARLDFVNLCSAASANVKTDTFHGNTANLNPGESATMWYIATADIWTDGFNSVPV